MNGYDYLHHSRNTTTSLLVLEAINIWKENFDKYPLDELIFVATYN